MGLRYGWFLFAQWAWVTYGFSAGFNYPLPNSSAMIQAIAVDAAGNTCASRTDQRDGSAGADRKDFHAGAGDLQRGFDERREPDLEPDRARTVLSELQLAARSHSELRWQHQLRE